MNPRAKSIGCPVSLMLDSGAFSAWRSGRVIDVDAYGSYLEQYSELFHSYINLDVLPDVNRGASNAEECAAAGWKNYRRLRKRGLHPMPVFHIGERYYWLEKMIGEGADFIGLGGLAMSVTPAQKRAWLDRTFAFLCGDRGWPPCKVHGFALTSVPLMLRYPWYSVDSTSWAQIAGFGIIFIPRKVRGVYTYDESPMPVCVSERGGVKGLIQSVHNPQIPIRAHEAYP